MSFTKKKIRVTITLDSGTFNGSAFGDTQSNTLTIENLRVQCTINSPGGYVSSESNIRIYGLSQDVMDAVTTLRLDNAGEVPNGTTRAQFKHRIAIEAGDEENDYTLVFTGNIITAAGDYNNLPDVYLDVSAQAAYEQQIANLPPNSYRGEREASDILTDIANQVGWSPEFHGVTGFPLSDTYLTGSAKNQAEKIAQAAGLDLLFEHDKLIAMPTGGNRIGQIPLLTAETGLVGYPTFDYVGVRFKCLFNPAILMYGLVQIDSDLPRANGTWKVNALQYELDSETPQGRWFCSGLGTPPQEVLIGR